MDAMINNFIIYISTIYASLTYCYYISSKIPKGKYRFISLVPVIIIFTLLPLSCTTVFTTAVSFCFTTWLTNFKLIRFAFDLDHSPYNPSDSLFKFILLTSLPIKSKSNHANSIKTRIEFTLGLGFKIVVFATLLNIVVRYKPYLHKKVISTAYGWILMFMIDIVVALVNAVISPLTGLQLEPSSNHPYLATSLQNFWGRWNLMITNSLRHTVYKPIINVFPNRKWAPLVGILASFLVSGLMHEMLVCQMSRMAPMWYMTLFFMVHGVSVVVEMIIKRALDGRWRLPELVGTVLTMGFLTVTGVTLFIPPFTRSHLDMKMLREYTWMAKCFGAKD
ncbi:wax synthase domain-containing protein [Artemisia annua]|uniref:Wax synthase domain-containing protein n=1 Tax=Artemisia annua TaxID=35608 RepID=A0A2U1LYW7_ARTAN|nr:wax synthase domain-containing protein [Artemisia annua]